MNVGSSAHFCAMSEFDIRWKQRLSNFARAIAQFNDAISLYHARSLSNLERQGLVQAFEFTHELAWKTLQDYLKHQGFGDLHGSRDVFRKSLETGLIHSGEKWFDSIHSRNIMSHVYDQEVIDELVHAIVDDYCPIMNDLFVTLDKLANS